MVWVLGVVRIPRDHALPAVVAIIETLDRATPIEACLTVPHEGDRVLLPKRDELTAHWVPDLVSTVEQTPARRT